MIVSFLDRTTEDIFDGKNSKSARKFLPVHLHQIAKRKLDMVNAAATLKDLELPPSNHLEKLQNRKHQHSIRVNDQYRIVFIWVEGNAEDVEIVDYH